VDFRGNVVIDMDDNFFDRNEMLREQTAARDAMANENAEQRERNLGYVAPRERYRYERRHAAPPEPKLDTDLTALIDQRVEEALATERPAMIEMMKGVTEALDDCAEKLARFEARIEYVEVVSRELERRALDPHVAEALGNDARKLKAEIATLQNCITELRGTVAAEAQRGVDLPTFRYPRDLN
jgi:hypothetical protein